MNTSSKNNIILYLNDVNNPMPFFGHNNFINASNSGSAGVLLIRPGWMLCQKINSNNFSPITSNGDFSKNKSTADFSKNISAKVSKAYLAITNYFENPRAWDNTDLRINTANKAELLQQPQPFWKSKKPQYIISDIKCIYQGNDVTLQFFYYTYSPISSFNPGVTASDSNKKNNINLDVSVHSSTVSQPKNRFIINNLSIILQKIYGCRVHVICNRVHYPYINAQILCQYLGYNANKNTFIHIWKSIINNPVLNANSLNAFIVGIKIIVQGRLITERIIPRITSKSVVIGTFSPKNIEKNLEVNIDRGKVHLKNKIGAFTITSEICIILRKADQK